MTERSIEEIRKRAKSYLCLTLKEWEKLIEEGNEEDLKLVIKHLNPADRVPASIYEQKEWWRQVNAEYGLVEGLKGIAGRRLREEFKPKPIQDYEDLFTKLKAILDGIEDEKIRKEIEKHGRYRIEWKEGASLLGEFLQIEYRWNISLEELLNLPPRIKKEVEEKINFPYTGFIKLSRKDQYTDLSRSIWLITPTIPISPKEISEEINKLIEETYLLDFYLEIKDFFQSLKFDGSEETKTFLQKNGLIDRDMRYKISYEKGN